MKASRSWLDRLTSWLRATPITEAGLREEFANMTDERLRLIDPAQLTRLARPLWEHEMRRRGLLHR